MTRKEAERQTRQADQLRALGFTAGEAEELRRISMTLQRWHAGECGTDRACLVRGRWDREKAEFVYADDGRPYWELASGSGRARYQVTPDRERGARKRLMAILNARNVRIGSLTDPTTRVDAYLQTDPRGAALYILRPGDVPEGKDPGSYYDRGICVW